MDRMRERKGGKKKRNKVQIVYMWIISIKLKFADKKGISQAVVIKKRII